MVGAEKGRQKHHSEWKSLLTLLNFFPPKLIKTVGGYLNTFISYSISDEFS